MSICLLVCATAFLHPALKPRIEYRLTVDPGNLSGVAVEMTIRGAPDRITLAASAHPEYDDKYWRYLDGFEARDATGASIPVTREDSVLWRLQNRPGDLSIRYRVGFPVGTLPRPAWKPFLTPTGGLIGGPHSFLYPLGMEHQGATVSLELPKEWQVGTALDPVGPGVYAAPDLETLMESPFQVGIQSKWEFLVREIPHRVFYWRLPDPTPFDTTAFVNGIQRIANGALALFGEAPFTRYTFQFQDGAYGGLEHPGSVTLGALSENLSSDPNAFLFETAHEFFHTWNLMHIQPAEYRGLDYRTQPPVAELWFSEGLTMFYADLLMRRAGLMPARSTRVSHLESAMARYLGSAGYSRFSAEAISRVAYNAGPGALGDYSAGVHLIGELLGAMLDLRVREATNGARSMDDVMRLMNTRFGEKRFTSRDVQRAVEEVCHCNTASLFEGSVLKAGPIDFNRYLASVGLRATVTRETSVDQGGAPLRDLRIFAYARPGEDSLRLVISDPGSAWGRAGLHTNDVLLAMNGQPVKDGPAFRAGLGRLVLGDSASLRVRHDGTERLVSVPVVGYDHPVVRLEPIPGAGEAQQRLRRQWESGSS